MDLDIAPAAPPLIGNVKLVELITADLAGVLDTSGMLTLRSLSQRAIAANPEDGNMTIPNLQRTRQALGLTLEQFSEDVGISISQLSRFESGHREPRVSELVRMAARLGIPPASFLPDAANGSLVPTGPSALLVPALEGAFSAFSELLIELEPGLAGKLAATVVHALQNPGRLLSDKVTRDDSIRQEVQALVRFHLRDIAPAVVRQARKSERSDIAEAHLVAKVR